MSIAPNLIRPSVLQVLPCNEHVIQQSWLVRETAMKLDHARAVIARVEISGAEPTFFLQQPPRAGLVQGVAEITRRVGYVRITIARGRFNGCTVEWRLP